jgi:hypothetical protein
MLFTPSLGSCCVPVQLVLYRHEEDRSPCGGLRQPDLTLLELDLELRAESVQLLLRQVINWASRRLLAVKEVNSQVLKIVARQKLSVYLKKDLYIGPIGLCKSRLRPGGHEDVFSCVAVRVEIQLEEVLLVAMCMLSVHNSNKSIF